MPIRFLFCGLGLLPFWLLGETVGPAIPEWRTDYSDSRESAQELGVPMVLFFGGSDWCVWCQKLARELFSASGFRESANREFIFVELDFPHNRRLPVRLDRQNRHLKTQFRVETFPTVLWVDPDTEEVFFRHSFLDVGAEAYINALNRAWTKEKQKTAQ
jgi:protein disulfide-isomerase